MVSVPPAANSSRYLPPVRTSISQDTSVMPAPFGTHHRRNSSGSAHALNTMCGGASNRRVTTSSRSDFRSTAVRFCATGLLLVCWSIFFLLFHLENDLVQGIEPRLEELAMRFDPFGLRLEAALPKLARPHPSDLLRHDEACPLQDGDMLLHTGQGNLSARLVIDASARPSCSSAPRRVLSDSAANERSREGIAN